MQLSLKIILPLFLIAFGCFGFGAAQSTVCPAVRTTSGWLDLFPLPCKKHAECRVMGTQHLCCNGFCTKGVKAQPIRTETETDQPRSTTITTSTSTTTPKTTTSTTTSTTTPKTTTPETTTTTTTTTPSTTTSSTTKPTTTTKKIPATTKKVTTKKVTTEAARPFLQLLPIQSTKPTPVKKTQATAQSQVKNSQLPQTQVKPSKSQKLVCPKPGNAPFVLFPIPCENNGQCRASSGPDQVCCERRCVQGVPAPRPTSRPIPHQPLLGVIPRECPKAPLGELLFEVEACKSDADCWPRVCCPDGERSYCRTARARLDLNPITNQIDGPVRMFERYLQCTAPPQYDLFPVPCNSSVDCFPNLCCAEGGKRHCRPPQRSLFSLIAGVSQRVGSTLGNLRQAQAAQAQANRRKS